MKIGIWINSRLYFWSDFSSASTTRPNSNRWRWIYSNIIHMIQFFSIAEQFDSFWVCNFGLGPLSGLVKHWWIIPIEISMLKEFFTGRSGIWIHLKACLNFILEMISVIYDGSGTRFPITGLKVAWLTGKNSMPITLRKLIVCCEAEG